MRIFRYAALSLLPMLLGCTASLDRPTIQSRGVTYPLLTGEGLRSVVVGQAFSFPEREGIITAPRCQGFNEDGTYFQCGDRVRIIPGRYVVQRDRVCATRGPYTSCWQIFGSANTGYLLRHVGNAVSSGERVCIRPVEEEPKPCL